MTLQKSLTSISLDLFNLLNSSTNICIFASGAGASGISALLGASGASSTILECRVPYSRSSFFQALDEEGLNGSYSNTLDRNHFSFASLHASTLLAHAALSRARRLAIEDAALGKPSLLSNLSTKRIIGVGLAAAVTSDRTTITSNQSSFSTTTDSGAAAIPSVSPSRRGTDRVFITSIVDDGLTGVETNRFEYSLQFSRKRSRSEEEDISGAALIRSVVKAAVHGRDIDSKSIIESIQNMLDSSIGSNKEGVEIKEESIHSSASSFTTERNIILLKRLLKEGGRETLSSESDIVKHVLFTPSTTTTSSSSSSSSPLSMSSLSLQPTATAFANFPICSNRSLPSQQRPLILPGSFDPLHSGHERLAQEAVLFANTLWPSNSLVSSSLSSTSSSHEEELPIPSSSWMPFFELSAFNVDKPPLELSVLLSRIDQFSKKGLNIIATRSPRFVDKVEAFWQQSHNQRGLSSDEQPQLVFVVGFDTAARLVDPKYYHQSRENGGSKDGSEEVLAALLPWLEKGVRFIVAGRIASASSYTSSFANEHDDNNKNVFLTYEEHLKPRLPKALQPLFVGLGGFREDISSSELRRKKVTR